MDLQQLNTRVACDVPQTIELTAPVTGKNIGVFISVYGKDSTVCQDYTQQITDDALAKAFKVKQRGKNSEMQTSAKLKQQETEFLAVCTAGWRQDVFEGEGKKKKKTGEKKTITFGNEELEFNHKNATRLYQELPWVAEQVDSAIGDLSLFMKS